MVSKLFCQWVSRSLSQVLQQYTLTAGPGQVNLEWLMLFQAWVHNKQIWANYIYCCQGHNSITVEAFSYCQCHLQILVMTLAFKQPLTSASTVTCLQTPGSVSDRKLVMDPWPASTGMPSRLANSHLLPLGCKCQDCKCPSALLVSLHFHNRAVHPSAKLVNRRCTSS